MVLGVSFGRISTVKDRRFRSLESAPCFKENNRKVLFRVYFVFMIILVPPLIRRNFALNLRS